MRSASEIGRREPAHIKSSCLSAAFSLPAADRTRREFALPALFFDSGAAATATMRKQDVRAGLWPRW
jgi:hypothetical protein